MKRLPAILGVLASGFAALVLRPVDSYQGFMVKSTATANSPALVVLGAVATALGLKRRSPLGVVTGAFGAAVGAWYIRLVTAPHDGFERAFGVGWQQLIPSDAERRMLRRRLTLRLPRTPEPRWTRDVPFWTFPDTGRTLLADIWQPPLGVEPTGTVIVYLYGGSWHFFDKDVLTRPFFRQLAARGHVVMDAGHRSCPEVDVTGMVGDVHRAVAWIRQNARRYGVDPRQVVLMGGSSGAHIALLAAYAPHDERLVPEELRGTDTSVMAVVSYYGIPDMYAPCERWLAQEESNPPPQQPAAPPPAPDKVSDFFTRLMLGRTLTPEQSPPAPPVRALMRNLLGGLPTDVPEMADLASPVKHVSPDCPPTLMFQGTHDAVVPLDAARRLAQALESAGVPVVYVELPWSEHAFDLMYPPMGNPAAKAALYDVERFLACVSSSTATNAPRILREG